GQWILHGDILRDGPVRTPGWRQGFELEKEKWMTITEWPVEQRPRERLLAGEASVLSDAELLAVLLRTGLPGRSAIDVGNELLAEYGGLRGLLAAGKQQALSRRGLGPAR